MNTNKSLLLKTLDHTKIVGIYGSGGRAFAKRMAKLHPDAAYDFLRMQGDWSGAFVLTDMLRSASASQRRLYTKLGRKRRGVKAPGHSAHNFGLAIDVAVTKTMKNLGLKTKKALDLVMAEYGWFCHRTDGRRKSEEWHYNYLGDNYVQRRFEWRTSKAVERKIVRLYGYCWKLGPFTVQRYLNILGFNVGRIDGQVGKKTRAGIKDFQSKWKLKVDGILGKKSSRLLWLCAQEELQ